jgi:hypothetical protein
MLLQCASPDAIARLRETKLKDHADEIWTEYFENQKHGSLKEYLVHCFRDDKDNGNNSSLVQVSFLILSKIYLGRFIMNLNMSLIGNLFFCRVAH